MENKSKGGMPPARYPQTLEQMMQSNEERKPKRPTRREMLEANKDSVSALVGQLASQLEQNEIEQRKISLNDTERVKDISLLYIRSCQASGCVPNLAGVALALGISRRALEYFKTRNPDHETSKWFNLLKEQFGETLMQAALDGAVAPIPAIFMAKANYGWRDDPEPEVQNNDGQEELSPDAIAAKWQDLPE